MLHEFKIQGEIDPYLGYALEDLQRELKLANDKGATGIKIKLNSPGGSVFEGMDMYEELLEYRDTGKTVAFDLGVNCASIATVLLQAATVGMRRAQYYTLFMIHESLTESRGHASSLKGDAHLLEQINEVILNIYQGATKKNRDEIKTMLTATTWFTPQEALANGFIDEIIPYDAKEMPKEQLLNIYNSMSKMNGLERLYNRVIKNIGMDEDETPGAAAAPEDSAPSNASTTLADGTTVYHDGEVATGIVIYTDEEMTAPVGAGTHTLGDGTIVITDEAGMVVEITSGEELVAEVTNLMKSVNSFKAEMSQMKKEIEALMKAPTGAKPVNKVKPDVNQAPERAQKLRGKVLGANQIENFSHLTKAALKLIPNEFKK